MHIIVPAVIKSLKFYISEIKYQQFTLSVTRMCNMQSKIIQNLYFHTSEQEHLLKRASEIGGLEFRTRSSGGFLRTR